MAKATRSQPATKTNPQPARQSPEGPKVSLPTPSATRATQIGRPQPSQSAPAQQRTNQQQKTTQQQKPTTGKTVFTFNPLPPGTKPPKVGPDGPPTLGPDGYFYPNIPTGISTGQNTDATQGEDPRAGGEGDGGGGDGGGFDPMAAYYAEQARLRSMNLVATLRGVMETYGLTSLMGKIEQYVKDGYEADAVLALIRQTPEYEARFPAMKILAGKQRSISEAEYIAYERRAAELERAYGMPAGMLNKDSVTKLIGNEVSANELEQRLTLAASGAYQTAPQVRQQFEQYYGIGTGALTAYFLDPDKALPLLNKQFVSAQIGAQAAMQGIGVGVDVAQQLQEAGITEAQAREGFQRVGSMTGLTAGRGDVVTESQLIQGNLLQNAQAQREIERTAASRRGRFEVGGDFTGSERGLVGLGSAAAT